MARAEVNSTRDDAIVSTRCLNSERPSGVGWSYPSVGGRHNTNKIVLRHTEDLRGKGVRDSRHTLKLRRVNRCDDLLCCSNSIRELGLSKLGPESSRCHISEAVGLEAQDSSLYRWLRPRAEVSSFDRSYPGRFAHGPEEKLGHAGRCAVSNCG